jgi:flagellar M-ring protein FliF
VAKLFENFSAVWQRTSLVQRVLLVGIVLGCVGAGVLLVGWARQPKLSLLYSGLAPEEAAKIVEKIHDQGIAYELKDGGTTIYVPEEKKYQIRLSMAAQSLPTGGGERAGYSILDQEKLAASPFSQQVNFKRALEGELARTLERLDGVAGAKVLVAKPTGGSIFSDKEKDTSASVTLTLKGGRRLTPAAVAAVIHLVAGAVEGLNPNKVVVVDSAGNLLSGDSAGNEMAAKARSFLDYKTQVEQYLSSKAEDMLTAVLGPGKASVRVDATIETSSVNQTTETYLPDGRVVAKERIESRSQTGAPPAGEAKPAGNNREETTESEYMVSRTTSSKLEMPGKVTALTVAAFVDLTPPKVAQGQTPPPPVTEEKIREIIRRAVGIKDDTSLTVVNTVFNHSEPAVAAEPEPFSAGGGTNFYLEIAERASLGVLVIGALVALKLMSGRKSKAPAASGGLALEGGGAGGNLLPAGAGGDVNADVLRARITRALQDNPEEVKRLFLNWAESEKAEV